MLYILLSLSSGNELPSHESLFYRETDHKSLFEKVMYRKIELINNIFLFLFKVIAQGMQWCNIRERHGFEESVVIRCLLTLTPLCGVFFPVGRKRRKDD